MTRNIVDITNQQASAPIPDEKAQIVIAMPSAPSVVLRYRTFKKAKSEYAALNKFWKNFQKDGTLSHPIIDIDADMFIASVDVSQVASIALVDFSTYDKFVPHQ